MPARNQAGAWLLTQSRAVEKLADVLEERAKELDVLGLGEFDFLPFEKQKEVQERFRDRWLKSTEGGFYAQEAWDKTRTKDAYNRTLESYYRKSQHQDYGGRLWQYCLLALGCLPRKLIKIVNEVIRERTEASRAAQAASSSTASASTRGHVPRAQRKHTEGSGVRHKRCNIYGLRTRCKQLDSQIQRQEYLWSHGRRHECMSQRRYNALLQEREEAWDAAEAESKKTGNPYKNRNKEMVKPPPKDMIGLVLRRYCDQNGLHYE